MCRFFIFCILFALCGGISVPAAENIMQDTTNTAYLTVPLEITDGQYFLTAETSLGRMKFMVDTGTQTTEIFSSSLSDLSKVRKHSTRLIGIGKSAKALASGQIQMRVQLNPLQSFSTKAIVYKFNKDIPDYDGILGLDFLNSYCVLLDGPRTALEVFPKYHCVHQADRWIALPTKWTKSGILVPIKIKFANAKNASTFATIDTGVNVSLLLSKQFRHPAGLSESPKDKADVHATGINGWIDADMVKGGKFLLGHGPIVYTGNLVIARNQLHPNVGIFSNRATRFNALLGTASLSLLSLEFDPELRIVYVRHEGGELH